MAASYTEVKEKLESILRSDATLNALLGKSASPYGVYFVRPPSVSPPFPLVVYKSIGAGVGGGSRESQVRSLAVQVAAYSLTNCDEIMQRVDDLLSNSTDFTGMTTFDVFKVHLFSAMPEDFDPEFNCYVKAHRYRIYNWKAVNDP
jgi:hypothetical protein